MIHIFIGTKAQLIKLAPLMKELDQRGWQYNFIDSGQHADFTQGLIKELNLKQPDYRLQEKQDITTLTMALRWFCTWIQKGITQRKKLFKTLFKGEAGICLIHGDTLSTLLALFLAKRAGLMVAHVEAGLRSFHWWHPFPEELIRLITMRFSDLLFAPSETAYQNLITLGVKGKVVKLAANSSADAIKLSNKKHYQLPSTPYALITIHRFETIYHKKRLTDIVSLVKQITEKTAVLFIVHPPTRNRLKAENLWQQLEDNKRVTLRPLAGYLEFITLMKQAEFLVTDGGSQQEESYYLNIPCLLMRNKTERQEGLGENAVLSYFDPLIINQFLAHYQQYQAQVKIPEESPSKTIVTCLEAYQKTAL